MRMTDPTRRSANELPTSRQEGTPGGPNLDLAGAMHDVRQMLAVISGRAGVLLARVTDDPCRESLRAIELAALDAGFILDRLDRASRGEAAGEPESAPLRQSAEDAVLLITPPDGAEWNADPAGRWFLENEIDGNLVVAMPAQNIREVLGNLLLNALEASPEGVTIRLAGERRDDRVVITLTDDGPGVPAQAREAIFEAGVSTSGRAGRGVGLAGCRRLLARWAAELRLAPPPSTGAAFELDLPLADGEPATSDAVDTSRTVPLPDECRVLIVDDERAVREMLTDVMAELGAMAIAARSATEAMAAFEPDAFDLVVLDQSLPGTQGDELAARLRASDAAVAVALITGWGGDEKLAAADPAHVDLTARKPLDIGKMKELLAEGAALTARRRSVS